MLTLIALLALAGLSYAGPVEKRQATSTITRAATTTVPEYFQITPESYNGNIISGKICKTRLTRRQGPTQGGSPPFLAETNPAPFNPTKSFVANTPLETAVPIVGANNRSIYQLMGQLSSYFPNPEGYGINEYPLPPGANLTQVHMISRHGSRYPTSNSTQLALGNALVKSVAGGNKFSGNLSFLNSWTYKLGAEIMVHVGYQELFDSGVLHWYDYGSLYNPNATFVARTTTQERMRESAEYFLSGFIGFDWFRRSNVKLEFILEGTKFNDSLAGYFTCNNSNNNVSATGNGAVTTWTGIYLKNATARLKAQSGNYNWTVSDSYNAQSLCAYETVAVGYSAFCNLFTYDEWFGYSYAVDLSFKGNNMYQSPTGRAVGVGYVQEVLGRINHQYPTAANTSNNVTLDGMPETFPLNQSLYFDFSHDTNIAAVITAFGITKPDFASFFPATGPPANYTPVVSRMTPFGCRLDIELIETRSPVNAQRSGLNGTYAAGNKTTYVHFVLNQRTVPLGASYPACGARDDGWCELQTFVQWQTANLPRSQYKHSCFDKYPVVPYGNITDGVPVS